MKQESAVSGWTCQANVAHGWGSLWKPRKPTTVFATRSFNVIGHQGKTFRNEWFVSSGFVANLTAHQFNINLKVSFHADVFISKRLATTSLAQIRTFNYFLWKMVADKLLAQLECLKGSNDLHDTNKKKNLFRSPLFLQGCSGSIRCDFVLDRIPVQPEAQCKTRGMWVHDLAKKSFFFLSTWKKTNNTWAIFHATFSFRNLRTKD